jgi:hypothetical protein
LVGSQAYNLALENPTMSESKRVSDFDYFGVFLADSERFWVGGFEILVSFINN